MRTVIVILVVIGLGGLYAWQKKAGESSEPSTTVGKPAQFTASPVPATSPVHEVSEHNWIKRSLDRARDVRDQARTSSRDSQNP
jgi:hypothetical protein